MELVIALLALGAAVVALIRGWSPAEAGSNAVSSRQADAGLARRISELEEQQQTLLSKLRGLEGRVQEQEHLTRALVTEDEARHLWFLSKGVATHYDWHPILEQELRSLHRRGFIAKRGDFNIHELGPKFDLVERFELTPQAQRLLKLRAPLEQADLAASNSVLPRAAD